MIILKKIKRLIIFFKKILSGRYKHFYKSVYLNTEWFGNDYGGFYLYPDVIKVNPIILSFGIGKDISFDRAISDRFHCKVNCFDPTPKSISWVNDLEAKEVKDLKFYQYGLSYKSHKTRFFLPKNQNYVSGSTTLSSGLNENNYIEVKLKNINDICSDLKIEKIDVLKMDIEGAEYEVLENLLTTKILIGQILVEFHDRFFSEKTLKSKSSVKLLKNYGYIVSNYSITFEEVSFIHSSLIKNNNK